jgi:beta-galactosidase
MGICILAETANWASDGGPKMDSPLFWEHSKDHLKRMVLRDRNHASVFGWSISNENKPVILYVYNKPEWMAQQKQAWVEWRDIVRANDSTRPWISSDGEDDGEGILPTTVGHYGDKNSMKHWAEIGKPWGVGEHSMAYYGTPEQVAKYNGERAYESQAGRMEGLAYECYDLIAQQRLAGAAYVSVFNIAWYALQPLPFGKRDLTTPPSLEDGIHFGEYKEGQPGIQPERMGPYCSTFNPGYDPTLPLYRTWAMFDAIKAANAGDAPAWSKWSRLPEKEQFIEEMLSRSTYRAVFFIGEPAGPVKQMFEQQGLVFETKAKPTANSLVIIEGKQTPSAKELAFITQAQKTNADFWIWSIKPDMLKANNSFLPAEVVLSPRTASSFLPERKSWMESTVNSDFYFCEVQERAVSQYVLSGALVNEGIVLLNACPTDWRKWNKRAEELKTAAVLRSENETTSPSAVFVKYFTKGSTYYISTLDDFTGTEKGYKTLEKILSMTGIPTGGKKLYEWKINEQGEKEINWLAPFPTNNK